MKVYVTRHGQTDYNINHRILGTTEVDLNETGYNQAKQLAQDIKDIGDVDIIIASPMKRTMQTAEIVAKENNLQIVTDLRLREWNYGEYEGVLFDERPDFAVNKREFGVKMGKTGESLLQFSHRVFSALDNVCDKYQDKNVLLVTHGGVCRVIEMYFNDMTVNQYNNWFMGNCQIIEYNL